MATTYPVLASDATWYTQGGTTVNKATITEVNFADSYTPSGTVTSSWDASSAKDGSIMVYIEGTKLTIVGNGSGKISANVNSSNMFNGFSKLVTITNASILDTSQATTFERMFQLCVVLESVDVSTWNTGNVTTLKAMFQGTPKIKNLDVSNWNTSNVTDMSFLFNGPTGYENKAMTALDVSNWDASSVTTMRQMFVGCESIAELDVSNWDVSSVTDMYCAFKQCKSLNTLDVGNWNTGNVTDMSSMFADCEVLSTLNVSGWNTNKVTSMQNVFYGCTALTSLDTSSWNTSSVTKMSGMFHGCSSLASLDTELWQTGNVTDMKGMFANCFSLKTLNVSNWDVSKVTDMRGMFKGGSYGDQPMIIETLDVNNWNTGNVTDMSFMFYACKGPKTIDVSNWDVGKVTTFDHMFAHSWLIVNGTGNWVTTAATNMNAMFHTVQNEIIDVANFYTSGVQFFTQMFEYCYELTRIIGLENFDTSNGLGFDEMFQDCHKIKFLNLSSFDTTKAKDGVVCSANESATKTLLNMFNGMTNLEKITLSSNFSFNGDGTTASNIGVLPTPSSDYITGADGNWYTFVCDSYAPADVPNKTSNTYYASRSIVKDLDVLTKNGVFIDIADSIRNKNGTDTRYRPSEMGSVIDALSIHAWKIRPAEPIGYRDDIINPEDFLLTAKDLEQYVQGEESIYDNIQDGSQEFLPETKDGYIYSFYKKILNYSLPNIDLGIAAHIGTIEEPIYADWEFKISTDPNFYPTDGSTIEIDGVEYECKYLGVQDSCINASAGTNII